MSKKILITGSTGFVGRQVLSNLLKNKIKVRAIIRKARQNFFKDKYPKVELIITNDLFKESADWWAEQCKGIHTIIHVAWYVENGKYLQSPNNIDCLIGSLNLVKGGIKAGIKRFVGIGTCFEYDLNIQNLSVDTPLKPSTTYAAAKAGLYTFISQLLPLYSIEFSWCRLFYLYGEGEDKRRLVPYLHDQLSKGKIVKLTSGKQTRDFLDVSKVGQIITNIAMGQHQGPINICSGVPITVRQLAEQIANEYGRLDLLKFGQKSDNLVDPLYIVGVPNYEL